MSTQPVGRTPELDAPAGFRPSQVAGTKAAVRPNPGVTAGQVGGGKDRRTGVVDIATLQTLSKRTDVAEISAAYGLVIVDECHHVPAVAFENAVRQIPVRRWLGLTATPTAVTA